MILFRHGFFFHDDTLWFVCMLPYWFLYLFFPQKGNQTTHRLTLWFSSLNAYMLHRLPSFLLSLSQEIAGPRGWRSTWFALSKRPSLFDVHQDSLALGHRSSHWLRAFTQAVYKRREAIFAWQILVAFIPSLQERSDLPHGLWTSCFRGLTHMRHWSFIGILLCSYFKGFKILELPLRVV